MKIGKVLALLMMSNILNIAAADMHGLKITPNNGKTFQQAAQASPSLTPDEKRLLADYTERMKREDPKYPASLYGKTVGQMLAEQSAWEAQKRAQDAEERLKAERARGALEAELRKSLTFTLREKSAVALPTPADPERKQVKFWFVCVFKNESGRPIKAIQGMVVLTDLFGKKIATLGIEVTAPSPFPAGETLDWWLSAPISQTDPVDLKLNNTALEAMRVEWVPQSIIYADGTRLGESAPFEAGVKILYDEELLIPQEPSDPDDTTAEDEN